MRAARIITSTFLFLPKAPDAEEALPMPANPMPPLPGTHGGRALHAAQRASTAASELLRFAREGRIACSVAVFDFMADPAENLAQALGEALAIDIALLGDEPEAAEYVEAASQLRAALDKFMSDTTGEELAG